MDAFEGLIRLVMERQNYWTRQSHKVRLSKEEKREIGKPSMPRPEIDLLAFDLKKNLVIALEVKSYLDSGGVNLNELKEVNEIPSGRYKLFTCERYRDIVLSRLRCELVNSGLINGETTIVLGLAAGNIKNNEADKVETLLREKGFFFIGPDEIKERVLELAETDYENDPFIVTAKVALRD